MKIDIFVPCTDPKWLCKAEVELETWTHWRVLKTACTERLGPVLGRLKPCYQGACQPSPDTRWEAVRILEEAGQEAVPLLLQALEDPEEQVVRRAIIALDALKDDRAVPALSVLRLAIPEAVDALQSIQASPQDLDQAVQVLASENRWGIILRAIRYPEVQDAVQKLGEIALEPLGKALTSISDAKAQVEIASLLVKIGGGKAVPYLAPIIEHEDWWVRGVAFETLAQLGEAPVVLRGLQSAHADIRQKACKALAQLQAEGAAPAIIAVADDPNEDTEVVGAAVYALGYLNAPERMPALARALAHPAGSVRFEAVRALGRIASPEAIASLKKAAHDADDLVRKEATKLLEKLESKNEDKT